MAVGPVDVYIIGFPGNKFTGRIAPAIIDLVENGTIRVLDLLFVMKDADGVVTSLKAADIDEEGAAFLSIDVTQPGALGPEDADEVSDDLPSNSSALLVAFENLWAGKLVDALDDAAVEAHAIFQLRTVAEVVFERHGAGGEACRIAQRMADAHDRIAPTEPRRAPAGIHRARRCRLLHQEQGRIGVVVGEDELRAGSLLYRPQGGSLVDARD